MSMGQEYTPERLGETNKGLYGTHQVPQHGFGATSPESHSRAQGLIKLPARLGRFYFGRLLAL